MWMRHRRRLHATVVAAGIALILAASAFLGPCVRIQYRQEYQFVRSPPEMPSPLHDAIEQGRNVDEITRLVQTDPSLLHRRVHGTLPLHLAALYGHVEIARFLLAQGADVNARTADELPPMTPLGFAVSGGDVPMARLLIEAGADVSVRLPGNYRLIDVARKDRNWPMVELLQSAQGGNARRP